MKIEYPEHLPISEKRVEIIEHIQSHPVVIISGSTGSGKTTQIPKMCLEAGFGVDKKIGCTQPRRVAALSVAQRISEELKVPYGELVGSKIRFNDKTSRDTRIQVMTDGILLQEFQSDPMLRAYDVLIIDEAHERSLNIDFALGLLLNLLKIRKDLKVIITSATIDTEKFSKVFSSAPIVEVSGTLYPIQVDYRPVDPDGEDRGDYTYIEASVDTAESLVRNSDGDILVFLPTEADIRECLKGMEGRLGNRIEVIPLFGRLSTQDQQRIFHPGGRQRVILSTNIAETSVTVPRIESVIDAGLARISRYSHATGTLRLPIEKVSRSSADQRKGRCGRLRAGHCVRLYDEEDYLSRPEFSEPEIFRANLGSVILRLLSLKIYDVDSFPFVDPPNQTVIRSAYKNLQALGAINNANRITEVGRRLVKLPIDLTVGCMMLKAEKLGVLHEVAVIGAVLSIQDPRERPENNREQAEQEHKRFVQADSDFFTLYNIWKAFHTELERMSQSQMRKFCKKHYLSYMRMREWLDIYNQIIHCFKVDKKANYNKDVELKYDAIHQSILSGLIMNLAQKTSGNNYLATRNREVSIFPGSSLYDRKAVKQERKLSQKRVDVSKDIEFGNTPEWIVAGSIAETSRIFARCVGRVEPEWVLAMTPHLIKRSYNEPHWSEKSGRVLVQEKVRVFGLLLGVNKVGYGAINPAEAKEIFIRSALISFEVRERLPFLERNQKVIEAVEEDLSRNRNFASWHLQDKVFDLYNAMLPNISSIHELSKWLRETENREVFKITPHQLMDEEWKPNEEEYPSSVKIGAKDYKIVYRYQPGDEKDGATLVLTREAFSILHADAVEWIVPGYISEKIEYYLKALPKAIRTQIFPIGEAVSKVERLIEAGNYSLLEAITESVRELYSIPLTTRDFDVPKIPVQLTLRFEVIDNKGKIIASGRDYKRLEKELKPLASYNKKEEDRYWKAARKQWEIPDVQQVDTYDLPEKIEVGAVSGIPSYAYSGFLIDGDKVSIRLFKKQEEARIESRKGFRKLFEWELSKDIAWLQRDLNDVKKRCHILYASMGKMEDLQADLLQMILLDGRSRASIHPFSSEAHQQYFERLRESWRGLVPRIIDQVVQILELRHHFLMLPKSYLNMKRDLQMLVPARFAKQTPLRSFSEVPRYLKSMDIRNQRWATNTSKDLVKYEKVKPYEEGFYGLLQRGGFSAKQARALNKFFWLLQEYKVSVFAPELKTAIKVSDKIMDTHWNTTNDLLLSKG